MHIKLQVPEEVRQSRRDELTALQQRVGEAWAKRMLGHEIDVLVDGEDADGVVVGRSQYDAPDVDPLVLLTESDDRTVAPLEAGQMRRVRIVDHITFDLVGQPVS